MFDVARGRAAIAEASDTRPSGISRRRFIGYLIAAPTLVAARSSRVEPARRRSRPHQPVDAYDLTDLLTDAALPTVGADHGRPSTRRHRLVRAAARRGRPGDHDRGGDDDRRRDGPAARQGQRDAGRRPPGAGLEPAHRRLELDALDLHPGSRRGGDRARASCSRPRPATARRTAGRLRRSRTA